MADPQQTLVADEEQTIVVTGEEQTLVAPRFDNEETLVARPVVPLEAVEDAAHQPPSAPARTTARRRLRGIPRAWLLPLMLFSVLVGGVLGGAGLYLYQRQTGHASAPAPAASQAEASTGAAQPTPADQTPAPDAQAVDTQAAPADQTQAAPTSDGAGAERGRDAGNVPASERRNAHDDDGGAAVAPRHGKKGEHDEEIERSGPRANRADSDAMPPRADATNGREARRVDTIFYRPRRATTRERTRRQTAGDTDRLRRIFEGTPE